MDQKKRKEGGTRKGAREQSLAPKEVSPPPPHRRRPATPQRITAACSSTHDAPTRASAGAQIPDLHGVHERWCSCHGRSSHRQNIQTNRDRDETRDSTKRGVGKRGAGPQKSRRRAAAMAARALSLILKRTVRCPPESPSRLHVLGRSLTTGRGPKQRAIKKLDLSSSS